MGCSKMKTCCKNTDCGNVARVFAVFALMFGILAFYFSRNSFVSQTTGLIVSGIVAILFSTGIAFSVRFRCSAHVCMVELFSGFGLLLVFFSLSWFAIAESLDAMFSYIHIEEVTLTAVGNSTFSFSPMSIVKTMFAIAHYAAIVPFFFLFVHSMVYVCLWNEKKEERKLRSSTVATDKDAFVYSLLEVFGQGKGFIIGGFFWGKVILLLVEYLLYLERGTENDTNPIGSISNSFYFIAIIILLVLSPFGRKILKYRADVIKSYFKTEGEDVKAKKKNFLMKPISEKAKDDKDIEKKGTTKVSQKTLNDQSSNSKPTGATKKTLHDVERCDEDNIESDSGNPKSSERNALSYEVETSSKKRLGAKKGKKGITQPQEAKKGQKETSRKSVPTVAPKVDVHAEIHKEDDEAIDNLW